MAQWLHTLQQFHFSIIHRPGDDHGNADRLSRAPASPCRQCTRPDCPPVVSLPVSTDQPFDSESTGSSEDADLIPIHSGEDWVAQFDDDSSQPTAVAGHSFRMSALQREYTNCITLHTWISSGEFPPRNEVKGLHPELRSLWHQRNNLSLDNKMELFGGNIVHRAPWDPLAMDILDVCDPTPEGHRYILVTADYFSKWTEAFPMKNKCADTVADLLVEHIILRFGMPLVIHCDQGREFENGLMKSLCTLLGCTKTRTAPYHPESDGMIERFNRTCLMMLSMFVNDQRDNWHRLLSFVMHACRTSVHESTGYSPFRLMMGEECSLPQDVSTPELRTNREHDVSPHPIATWVRDALEVAYDHVRESVARRKRLYDTKAVNRKFPVGSWVLRYYPPAAQHKLGSPWIGPQQVVFVRPPVIRWAFRRHRRNPSYLFM